MTWRPEEERILADYASRGVAAVARELILRLGSVRSETAIRTKASRMGISMKRYVQCPECGEFRKALTRDGLCRSCHYKALAEKPNREADEMERMVMRGESDEREARRAYDRARQRKSQARKKLR